MSDKRDPNMNYERRDSMLDVVRRTYSTPAVGEPLTAEVAERLRWLANRLVMVYGESENTDYILHTRSMAAAIAARAAAPLDVERLARLAVHECRGRLLTAPADQEAAAKAVLIRWEQEIADSYHHLKEGHDDQEEDGGAAVSASED